MKYIASVSFGKDSTAMLIKILENHYPLDCVVFYDTGMEFDIIYKYRDWWKNNLKENGIEFVELHPTMPFIKKMVAYPHQSRDGKIKLGYGWCGGLCRWGTTEKVRTINNYCKDAHQYVGIAYDEEKRHERLNGTNKSSPIYDLKLTESDCLKICYDHGFDYNGLYEHLDRVSCWCCRNKNLREISNYKKCMPYYYKKLVELEKLIGEPMKKPYTLIERFGDVDD